MDDSLYAKHKEAAAKHQRAADRAAGARDAALTQLRKEHACSSVKEAEALLDTLAKQETKLRVAFEKACVAYEAAKDELEA